METMGDDGCERIHGPFPAIPLEIPESDQPVFPYHVLDLMRFQQPTTSLPRIVMLNVEDDSRLLDLGDHDNRPGR